MNRITYLFLLSLFEFNYAFNSSKFHSKRYIKTSELLGKTYYSLCEPPPAPKSGNLLCSSNSHTMLCTANCMTGFTFPDGGMSKKHTCSVYDGIWEPEMIFPDCEPVCEPPCANGGHCFGNNQCVCAPGFRGDYCEFPISNCDGNNFFPGSWSCNHTSTQTLCTISCPAGTDFEYPPSHIYSCDIYGNWNPKSAPKCHEVDVIFNPLSIKKIEPVTFDISASTKVAYSLISMEKSRACTTWGQLHYRTFGGSMFSFQGKCNYLLARDCASDTFSVRVKNDPFCNGVHNCKRQVIIDANNRRYKLENTLNGAGFFVNDEELEIPSTIHGMVVENIGRYIVLESGLGFKVGWDTNDKIFFEVQSHLLNSTCGLCGRIDTSGLIRDLELPDGSITTSIISFANSWKVNDIDDYCPDASGFENHCKYDTFEHQKLSEKADEVCGRIFNSEFAACHMKVDPQPYYEMCRMDFCGCQDKDNTLCICSTLAEYFQECSRLGGQLPTSWRSKDFCAYKCSEGLEYRECGSSCPSTCKKNIQQCTSDSCVEGCFCPSGTVLHNNKCVRQEDCPCHYNEKEYDKGATIVQDCNACVCENSHWECTKEKCESRCSAVGDPHYTTFDGRHFDFMGKCTYYLMQDDDFSIEQENIACSGAISEKMGYIISPANKFPSCTKSVIIRIKNNVIQLKQRLEVTLNRITVSDFPLSAPGIIVYFPSSMFLKVELDNGIKILWDGISRVYIDAPPSFFSKTKGLCGTFNHNQKDDFFTVEGDIEQDITAFANKWKTSETCNDIIMSQLSQDPCEVFPHRKEEAHKYCSVLQGNDFSNCHDVVDYEPFYKNCMYDMCYCQVRLEECLCPSLADYGVKCSKKGQIVDWRAHVEECGMSCPGDQTYQTCGSSCRRSCIDISYHTNCQEECVEGCNCPPGKSLNRYGECIPISSCSCVHGGRDFNPGHLDVRGNSTCECVNAQWKCREATAAELMSYTSSEINVKPLCSSAANKEYTDCASDCPKTCKNMHSQTKCNMDICKPGCNCKKGYVLDTKSERCVKESDCPCYHGGYSYAEGDTIKEGCNECICEGGTWTCQVNECPATCEVWGNSHFKTFDGRVFDFHGDCEYLLTKGGKENYETFSVAIRNVLCGTSDITCSKTVVFQIDDEKLILSADRLLSPSQYGSRFILRDVGLFTFIHTDIGITIQWDKKTRVYIRADVRWKNSLVGLCGNYNNDETDDFLTPDGGLAVVKPTSFGDSWRLKDYCPISKIVNNTCDLNPNRKSWALKQCSVLKSDLFKRCHSEVPVDSYMERCIFDTCGCDMGGDCECLCTALAAYAQECSNNGVVVKWRSQSLCPIQCEDCAEYNGCISVCPPITCETEFLYESIENTCSKEACVEGCKPKPCPPGQKFNNPREWKCIPDKECLLLQPCKVINGKIFYEGQRIDDPEVSDMCQSCFCRRGNIVCIGKKCSAELPTVTKPTEVITTESTTTPSRVQQATCEKDGWTEWMNGFKPSLKNGGDFETLEMLRKRFYTFCPLENILHIECRTAITHKLYNEIEQSVTCSLPKGLVCNNNDQLSVKLCQDYEIRVYCQCSETTEASTTELTTSATTPSPIPLPEICEETGWTPWMNSKEPNNNGEYEIIPELRKHYSFCSDSDIDNVECRPINSLDMNREFFPNIQCTIDRGLVCTNSDNFICDDHEVKFHCRCAKKGCPMPLGLESKTINDQQISVSSYQTPATLGHHGRLHEHSAWSAGSISEMQWLEIDLLHTKEISGIITQGHPFKNEWVTLYSIMYSRDGVTWDKVTSDNQPKIFIGNSDHNSLVTNSLDEPIHARFIRIVPIEWNEWISLRAELLGCDEFVSTLPPSTSTTTATTTTLGTPFPYQCIHGWTDWINIDSPFSFRPNEASQGDMELANDHRFFMSFCAYPSSIQCRIVGTETMAHMSNESTSCDLYGLHCTNSEQTNGICSDYEVRYFCNCEKPPEITTAAPVTSILPCSGDSHGWTPWMNSNNPHDSPLGDEENYKSLRSKYSFCPDFAIEAIECRLAGTNISFNEAGELGVVCDVNSGFTCLHSLQKLGLCKDFEVRFYCLCEETRTHTETATITSSIAEVTKWHEATTSSTIIDFPDIVCDAWTPWINMDTPDDDGIDSELFRRIHKFKQKCPRPIKFQCRNSDTWLPYEQSGQKFKEACNENGIVCESVDQHCENYEIRVYCLCVEKPTEPPCVHGWTKWFNTHSPSSGEGDFELLDDIRLKNEVCQQEYVTDAQCESRSLSVSMKIREPPKGKGGSKTVGKTYGTKTSKKGGAQSAALQSASPGYMDYTETGDIGVKCTTNGLSCYNQLQMKSRKCRDYRIRFYCNCGTSRLLPIATILPFEITTTIIATETTNICGWSKWLNSNNQINGNFEYGDFEPIAEIQSQYKVCEKPFIKDIECRIADTDTPWTLSGQSGLTCNIDEGFACENRLQNYGCYDYEIRLLCLPPNCLHETTTHLPTTTTITMTPRCLPGMKWEDCAYKCDQMCHSFLSSHLENHLCSERTSCVPGCVFEECEYPKVWRDELSCVNPEECTCIADNGQMLAPGQIFEVNECYHCQCIKNDITCNELESCKTTPFMETTTEKPRCSYWSNWINNDKPWIGIGDVENFENTQDFCSEGIIEAIECVRADDSVPANEVVGNHLICSVAKGFSCLNKNQPNEMCDDFKIRYFCACEEPTTPPPVRLCPEIMNETSTHCPTSCPENYFCDGNDCVDRIHCPCLHDGKIFKPGSMIVTSECEECFCKLNSTVVCHKKICPMCYYGKEGYVNENCECDCKTCPKGEILCPHTLECLEESRWCDGHNDCGDDEVDCPTTPQLETTTLLTTTTTTCPPLNMPQCKDGSIPVISNPDESCPIFKCEKIPTKVEELVQKYSCKMSSNMFSTFDGFQYSYDICDHVLVKDKPNNRFNITVHKSCESDDKGCYRYLHVSQGKHLIKVKDHEVEFDGKVYDPSQLIRLGKKRVGLSAKYVGDVIIIKSDEHGYEISLGKANNIEVKVPVDLKYSLYGLCGYFSSNPDDDKMTPNAEEVETTDEFGDSWALDSLEKCKPNECPSDIMVEADVACNELRLSPFDACNTVVDPTPFIKLCKASICDCMSSLNSTFKDCKCKAYLNYVEECEANNIIKIRYWRMKQSCLPDCPIGLVWNDCGSACERTCENMVEMHELDVCQDDRCVPGCFCPIGLVRKGDHCVKPEKCEDCVCKGYGDPHYFTYDGTYFPFQGNCTYILTRDMLPAENPNAKHKFEVYATNEDCYEEPMTTCTVAIMVLYNGHIAHFRVNESVTFDGIQLFPSDFPFHAYGIHIENIPGRSVTFTVIDVHLVVRYFELNYGFEIRLPSELYFNKTEGLCGNCNFNNSDDFRCKDGKITDSADEFGLSWIATPPEGFESTNEICKLKDVVECNPSIEMEMCDKLAQEIFAPCHALVNPEVYISACRFDICHSVSPSSSLCRAATEYARKCAEVGICIENWRTNDFCPYECPKGMQFKQCGSACPKSCKSVVVEDWKPRGTDIEFSPEWSLEQTLQEVGDVCDTVPVDGCFCHSSKVMKDGQCIDPVLCHTCDESGHKVGDTWNPNPCTSCVCTLKLKIECVKTQCPVPPVCKSNEKLHTIPADNGTCCETYECLEVVPTCPQTEDITHCKGGEVLKVRPRADTGCPEYFCECDIFHCPALQTKLDLDDGEETRVVTKQCCPEVEIVCNLQSCPPKPVCQQHQELKERKHSKAKCCPDFYCEAPSNVCYYIPQYEIVDGFQKLLDHDIPYENVYKTGEVWMDGLCRNCTCESNHGQFKQKCVVKLCARLNDYEDKDDYLWRTEYLPNVCCPKITRTLCVHKGVNYSIGEEWHSEENKCKLYRCDKHASGEAVKSERFIICDKNCKDGFEYFEPPESSKECCGTCKPVACVEGGLKYKVGQEWNSTLQNCYLAECSITEETSQIRYSKTICPPIATNCIKKITDGTGCCEECTEVEKPPSLHNCRPELMNPQQTVEMFEQHRGHIKCTNKSPIHNMTICVGNCASSSAYSTETHDFVSHCKCCSPATVKKLETMLTCDDGIQIPLEYAQPTSCDCSECSANTLTSSQRVVQNGNIYKRK